MSSDTFPPPADSIEAGPLGALPRLSARRLRLERAGIAGRATDGLVRALAWIDDSLPGALELGAPELLARASGLGKPGLNAWIARPGRSTRLGLGLETPLVHALVDRLLGFERRPGEERLPVTPVERGLIAYAVARSLAEVQAGSRPEWTLDRVGPEPFGVDELGPMMTLRWPVRVGETIASARLWLPEAVLPPGEEAPAGPADRPERFDPLASSWRAVAGSATLPRGLGWLRVGGVLTIDSPPLRGTVASPAGEIALTLQAAGTRYTWPGEAAPQSGGGRLVLRGPMTFVNTPREALPMSAPSESVPAPTEVPVTLTVELGRVSIPLHRLASLKPGDVLELGRHAREPVELTSNGRLVARGELVQIDTELGVRVTNVFL